MLNEPKTSRPRPKPLGQGQSYEAEARLRPELHGRERGQFLEVEAKTEAKNYYEKVPNND